MSVPQVVFDHGRVFIEVQAFVRVVLGLAPPRAEKFPGHLTGAVDAGRRTDVKQFVG